MYILCIVWFLELLGPFLWFPPTLPWHMEFQLYQNWNFTFNICDDYDESRKWGFEKYVYRDVKRGIRRDRKYAVKPRNLYATGVHMSENVEGKTTHKTEGKIMYFHYHGTIAERRESCRLRLNNTTEFNFDKTPYVLDTTMRDIGWVIKKFEQKMIGDRLINNYNNNKPRQWDWCASLA